MAGKFTIDRKKQKQQRKARFFDSNVMKVLGLAVFVVITMWILFGLCAASNSVYASQVLGFAEDLTLMWLAAVFSAVGIKVETASSG